MAKKLDFENKVVIITGAGGGLGRQYALMFGARGARVLVNDLGGGAHGGGKSSSAADRVVDEIKALGGDAVANYDSVEDGSKIVQAAVDAFGTVDIVINNAGILRDSSFLKMSMDDWELIYRVHLKGSMSVTHAAWPILRDKGYGRIIMTSSAAGIYGNFGQANYSAAKLGLLGLAKTLAVEGASKNIHVNTIAPIAASRLTETVLPTEVLQGLKPEYVSPLVGWLCHENCKENGGLFEVGAGIVNKLRWQRSKGVGFPLSAPITPEHMANHWEQIGDFSNAEFPTTIADSMVAAMDNINNPKLGGNQFLDLDKAKASKPVVIENTYDERDLSLYALGVGVGSSPLDSQDLQYLFERGNHFYALPTYGVIPALNGFMKLLMDGKELPGLGNVLDRVLHGEQYTEIKRPLPSHAKLRHEAKLRTAYDKGDNAIAIIDVHSFDESGDELAYNEISFFLRGCGGWGGDRGPNLDVNVPPTREPDAIVEEKIGANQGLIYRLSGDWNPLHIDPEFAKNFGFDKPILHGLCTFGYVGRHVVQGFLGNDPRRFKSIKVRFAKSVYPGETLVTRMWKESDTRILIECIVKERNEVVIKNAAVEFYQEIPVAKPKTALPAPVAAAVVQPTGPTSSDIFAAIGAYLATNPDEVAKANTVFQFVLKDPDSSWIIDAKAGNVEKGVAANPDVTLAINDDQFVGMCVGGEDAQKLFFSGKLKISGNMMAASKLEFLKKMDPALVKAEVEKRLAGGRVTVVAASAPVATPKVGCAEVVFEKLGALIARSPEAFDVIKGKVVSIKIGEPESAWTLDYQGSTPLLKTGADDTATTLLLMDEDLNVLMSGTESLQSFFQHGRVHVHGDMALIHVLSVLRQLA